jgi:ABC-2 type transport system permease protein
MLGLFLFYFLFGYLLYAALFAAVGSAVDNETDTQQFIIPISLPLILAYVMSSVIIQNPEGPAAFWFSVIPFTSPVVMMVRVAMGISAEALWELWLSMFLLVVTFIFMTWLAGRIYKTGIMMYGKKASYRELWKWLFYK